jgi:hypothetical protein
MLWRKKRREWKNKIKFKTRKNTEIGKREKVRNIGESFEATITIIKYSLSFPKKKKPCWLSRPYLLKLVATKDVKKREKILSCLYKINVFLEQIFKVIWCSDSIQLNFQRVGVRRSNFMRSKFHFFMRSKLWSWDQNSTFSWDRNFLKDIAQLFRRLKRP